MGWLTELSAVYDQVMRGGKDDKPLPLYHIANNAPLIIKLDGRGNFRSARLLGKEKEEKKNWQACMPCTEKSAARTSGVEAYPLCDKLEYVAADYAKYAKEGKNLKEKHEAYLSLLGAWAQSEYSNQKIKSIYAYVRKGAVATDILEKGKIAEINGPAKIAENNVFVRWEVDTRNDANYRTWDDPEIRRLWIAYYSKTCPNPRGFCYVTGKKPVVISKLHGQKIRNTRDGAKIISSNDSSNYTFRGRFVNAGEACQIGMEVSVKAHNALRWLIQKQGALIGNDLTIVSWCTASAVIPLPLESSETLWPGETNDEELPYATSENSAKAIRDRLLGYYSKIPDSAKILIMALKAATPGRISVLLYREFIKSDFYSAQEHWHINLAWFYSYWKTEEKRMVHTVSAPSPAEIVKAAYGGHVNNDITASVIQRLLPCIIDKAPIPSDIEWLCFNRALRPQILEGGEREKTLETACAVIKYNLYTQNGKEYKVGLEEDRKDRDYLFGRLLATADRIEARILYSRKEERETNAARYMQRFSRYPCSTWKLLYVDKLRPYISRLNKKSRDWYESLIQEITSQFSYDDYASDEALSGEFLLGYQCQQKEFWNGIAKLKAAKQPEPDNTNEEDK
jgi:CRISPR-associated protein Csd1